jgi:hypothetical protein
LPRIERGSSCHAVTFVLMIGVWTENLAQSGSGS